MSKNIEMAKVLMKDDWFSEFGFNCCINSIDRLDLPYFEDIPKEILESREEEFEDCDLMGDEECERNYACKTCPHNALYHQVKYHFKDSPSRAECEEQIEILKCFHII